METRMKKLIALILSLCLVLGCMAFASAETKTASAQGFGSTVTVTAEVEDGKITKLDVDDSGESYPVKREDSVQKVIDAIVANGNAEGVDAKTGATFTCNAVIEAVNSILAGGDEAPAGAITFTPGTYTATAEGYNGTVTVHVTFSENAIVDITTKNAMVGGDNAETAHVGTVAFDTMIPEMIEANGTGVDGVAGATFSGRALREAVNAAAEAAGCSDMAAFKAAKIDHPKQETIDETYDVVVVGAGGAGMAAAAQATQNGYSVLVIEKNAEIGGNTLVSGGQFQSVMPYLVWDPAEPDAAEGKYEYDGQTYAKVKTTAVGTLKTLQNILDWSEEPFDEAYYQENEFVAGDDIELAKHGVHAEYLPVLKALKEEIKPYLEWANKKMAEGTDEKDLTLFSTINLHIFQTYYGGLRQTADKSAWIYGDIDLVTQFIKDGQDLKPWLEAQGAKFKEDSQPTLIGALWYRENEIEVGSNWDAYFAAPMTTITGSENNKVLRSTTAKELIVEDGRVTGVKAVMVDGTEVVAHAKKGVVLCTGGYAANINLVLEDNQYWDSAYLTTSTKTTNRSSQQGDGIVMAKEVGAATTGMNFTQLMPISWVDNGNLAFGGGNYACWINPTTGERFVDEGSERDVLSLAEFRNGIVKNNTPGVFLEFYNAVQKVPGPPTAQLLDTDYEGRYYHIKGTVEELTELFKNPEFEGVTADPAKIIETIKAYDMAVMGQGEFPDVGKGIASRTIGNVDLNEDKTYNLESYSLEDATLIVRLMAPSTHHTMGGLKVDVDRHVLDAEGNIIPGLYAAGEVTGGIHGGNRLGGNAIVEIFVSGRTAANAIAKDN